MREVKFIWLLNRIYTWMNKLQYIFQQHFSGKDTSFLNVPVSAKQMRVKEVIPDVDQKRPSFTQEYDPLYTEFSSVAFF